MCAHGCADESTPVRFSHRIQYFVIFAGAHAVLARSSRGALRFQDVVRWPAALPAKSRFSPYLLCIAIASILCLFDVLRLMSTLYRCHRCDSSHKGTGLKPVAFVAETSTVWMCGELASAFFKALVVFLCEPCLCGCTVRRLQGDRDETVL